MSKIISTRFILVGAIIIFILLYWCKFISSSILLISIIAAIIGLLARDDPNEEISLENKNSIEEKKN